MRGRALNVGFGVSHLEKEGVPYDGPWTGPATREEIVKGFESGWEPDVQEVVKVRSQDPLCVRYCC